MNSRLIYVSVLVTLLVGCASDVVTLPPSSLSTPEMKIFSSGELEGLEYTLLAEVKGVDCSPTWFRISNSTNALNKLIEEANGQGANGLINVSCFDSGVGPVAWCNNSATCKGKAILYDQ